MIQPRLWPRIELVSSGGQESHFLSFSNNLSTYWLVFTHLEWAVPLSKWQCFLKSDWKSPLREQGVGSSPAWSGVCADHVLSLQITASSPAASLAGQGEGGHTPDMHDALSYFVSILGEMEKCPTFYGRSCGVFVFLLWRLPILSTLSFARMS